MLRQCLHTRTRPISTPPTLRTYRTKGSKNKTINPSTTNNDLLLDINSSKPIIDPGSPHHNDLASFTAYANRLSLSPTSTVYTGTRYEYIVASSLTRLGFTLTRTGRTSDHGIDLLGTWRVPSHPSPIRVLLQCKAHAKKLGPSHVRELEGSFAGAPARWQGEGVMGFLVSTGTATAGVREALGRSGMALGFVQVSEEGRVGQFLWNHEAGVRGLEGLGVTMRFLPGDEGVREQIALTWEGRVVG